MNRGRFRFATLMVSLLFGCSQFTSAEETESAGAGSTSSEAETSTASPTTNGTTAATDGEGPSTAVEPTTGDPSETSSNSEGETTSDPTPMSGTSTDTSSSSGSTSSAEASDSDASTGPTVCDQLDTEPNDTYAESQELPDQLCEMAEATLEGTLEDETDVDRFRFNSPWNLLDCGSGDPDHIYTVEGPVEVCVSAGCPDALGSFSCEDGTLTNFNGFGYCCGTETVRTDIFCTLNPSSTGFVIVRPVANMLECADYSVTYQVVFE